MKNRTLNSIIHCIIIISLLVYSVILNNIPGLKWLGIVIASWILIDGSVRLTKELNKEYETEK